MVEQRGEKVSGRAFQAERRRSVEGLRWNGRRVEDAEHRTEAEAQTARAKEVWHEVGEVDVGLITGSCKTW